VSHLRHLNPSGIAPPRSAYSHAIMSGTSLWLAGQVPIDSHGHSVGVGDLEAQTRVVISNIARILDASNASFTDVVRFTIYLVGRENVETFREIRSRLWNELYPDGNYPTSTLLVVAGLASEDFLVEIEATAELG
jgi:enamine deaminase RidA (YjgF/YER057c/UK114 family)